jgi:hypothetical protein
MLASVIGLISARRRAPVYAIELPDYIALEAADDLWLALARLRHPLRLATPPTPWCHHLGTSEPHRSSTAHT